MREFINNLWETHSDDVFLLAKNIAVAIIIIIIGIVLSKGQKKHIKKSSTSAEAHQEIKHKHPEC